MKKAFIFLTLVLSACASDPGPTKFDRSSDGPIMSTPAGLSLYTYDLDQWPGQSACLGECAQMFPPFLVDDKSIALARSQPFATIRPDRTQSIDRPAPLSAIWGTIRRPDGLEQWTYYGKPLYTYRNDKLPGERNGDRLYAVWNLVRPR